MAIVDRMVRKFEEILPEIPDTEKAQDLLNTLVYAKYFTHSISHYAIGMFRYYNGETERAEKHLNEWKRNWETYQNEVPHLSGVPTLIKDGGMEETCTSALADIERQR